MFEDDRDYFTWKERFVIVAIASAWAFAFYLSWIAIEWVLTTAP